MEPTDLARLSITIINRNTKDLLLACLNSILGRASEYEVIVVDNASTDASAEHVRTQFPDVIVFENKENVGYARACMRGLRESKGTYVLFLNSDTIVPPEALDRLISFLDANPRVAACAPRLANDNGMPQPFSYGNDPTIRYLLARALAHIGLHAPLHDWNTAEIQTVDWVSGACLITRRTAMDQIAGFDERIFMYFEDNDLCLRLRRAGWQVVYNPQITIIHVGGASLSSPTVRRKYYYESLLYFYSKHYPPIHRMLLKLLLPFYKLCFR